MESLISEFQSRKALCLNDVLKTGIERSTKEIIRLGIPFDTSQKDVQKILIHYIFIELCEYKKKMPTGSIFFVNKKEFNKDIIKIIDLIIVKMELDRGERSSNLLKNLKNYFKKNGYDYLVNVYLKQASNKLALFR